MQTAAVQRKRSRSRAGSPAAGGAFEHVALAFDDDVVLRDVSFSIPVGGMTVLLGASGSGKSLILKMILGLMRPDSGTIHINGDAHRQHAGGGADEAARRHRHAVPGGRALRLADGGRERRATA